MLESSMSEQPPISRRDFTALSIPAGVVTATGARSAAREMRVSGVNTPPSLALFKHVVV
jgi:hypothetical protein